MNNRSPRVTPTAEIERKGSGTHIVIDGHGAIPDSVTIANTGGGIRQLLQRDHIIGAAGFDERWHIGGEAGVAFALLTEQVRKKLDALGKKCGLRVDKGHIEAETDDHDMVRVGNLVKELTAVA